MRTIILLSFIFVSHIVHADLRQALNYFEKGYELKLLSQKETNVRKKSVQLKALRASFKSAATEFMNLRKLGATLPIAYLEYMRDKKLATFDGDFLWDETELRNIESARRSEVENAKDLDKTHPIPTIPACLLQESEDHLTTSRFAARIKTLSGEAKKAEILKLFEHFESTKSLNLRAFYYVANFIREGSLNWSPSTYSEHFQFMLTLKAANAQHTMGIIGYFIREKNKAKKNTLDRFIDPDFRVWSNEISLSFDNTIQSEIDVYNTKNNNLIAQHHLTVAARYSAQDPINSLSEFACAIQHGGVKTRSPIRIVNTQYDDVTPHIFISLNPDLSTNTSAYFSYLGDRLHKLSECKITFVRLSLPNCSAYGEKVLPKTLKSGQKAYEHFEFEADPFSPKAIEFLDRAAELGYSKAQFEICRRLIYGHDDIASKRKGAVKLKRLIKKNRDKKAEHYNVVKSMAMLANLYIQYEIGTPGSAFAYAKKAIRDRDLIEGDRPAHSLLGYFYYRGIGCDKDLQEAKRLQELDRKEAQVYQRPLTSWCLLIDTEEEIPGMAESRPSTFAQKLNGKPIREVLIEIDKEFETLTKKLFEIADKFAKGSTIYENTPSFIFVLKRFFTYFESADFASDDIPFCYFAIMKFIQNIANHNQFKSLRLYIAKALVNMEGKENILATKIFSDDERNPKLMLESALEAGHPEAFIFKAECIYKKKGGYGQSDRKKDLEEALKIYRKHQRRYNLDDKINLRRIENELRLLENKKHKKAELDELIIETQDEEDFTTEDLMDDSSDDEMSESSFPSGGGAAPVVAQAAVAAAACQSDSNDNDSDDTPLTEDEKRTVLYEDEWQCYIDEAKQKSAQKKNDLNFQHVMELPEEYVEAKRKNTKFIVNIETAKFVDMIYGMGSKSINHYTVDSAGKAFKDIGLAVEKIKVGVSWSYTDHEGIKHKLSFHRPHGHGDNKLYLAIRQRIKHFFERIGVTPETIELISH